MFKRKLQHILKLLSAVSLLAVLLSSASPSLTSYAADSCKLNGTVVFAGQQVSGNFYVGETWFGGLYFNPNTGQVDTLINVITANLGGGNFSYNTVIDVGGCVPNNFADGRCNQEPWQNFAVYPDQKGGFYFYAVYNGIGVFAMHVAEHDLDLNPDKSANYMIVQSQGIQLWRLAGGALQAIRSMPEGKLYSYLIACGLSEDGD